MLEPPHDLQLAVLEALVLQHLLDGHHLPRLYQLGLVDHSEAAVPNDLRRKGNKSCSSIEKAEVRNRTDETSKRVQGRASHVLEDLGWVNLDLGCSTILLGQ